MANLLKTTKATRKNNPLAVMLILVGVVLLALSISSLLGRF